MGFRYNGFSTENIIGTKLMLMSMDGAIDRVDWTNRENMIGSTTVTRPIPNDYGTTYNLPEFTYGLMKADYEPFTTEEQVMVEAWLTSPKRSSFVEIWPDGCDEPAEGEEVYRYFGKFTSTSYGLMSEGFYGVIFTFQSTSPYPLKHVEFTIDATLNGGRTTETTDPETGETTTETIPIDEPFVAPCYIYSDEWEEYVYPTVTITNNDRTQEVTITQVTDKGNVMGIYADELGNVPRLDVTFDCQRCILSDDTGTAVINFSDIGWKDVGSIYWLRFLPRRINVLEIIGDASIKIAYDYPYKKVGGWLV